MAITKQEVLNAYNKIKKYCMGQESCEDCLFAMEDGADAECLMEYQDTPNEWQLLDID